MSRKIGSMTVAAIACAAAGVAAQTSPDAASQNAPVARITVIGCVEPSDQTATGTTGDTSRSGDTRYHLTHAKSGKSGESTGSTSGSQTSSTYRLDDSKDTTLAPEVGHQVEIVAVVEPPDATGVTGTTGTTGSSSSSAQAPKLRVETVRVIAMSCPE